MFEHSEIFDTFRRLDAPACEAALGGDGISDPEVGRRFLQALGQSGCLVVKIENKSREKKRDMFVEQIAKLFDVQATQELAATFHSHVNDAAIVERTFRRISASMEQSDIWKLAPDVQAWGIIERGIVEAKSMAASMQDAIKQWDPAKKGIFDPSQLRIQGEDGPPVDADQVNSGIVKSVGTTLFLLAHKNGWIDPTTNEVVLPPRVTVDESVVFKSGTHTLLSLQWSHLERAWDRARLFDLHVKEREIQLTSTDGETRVVNSVVSDPPTFLEVFDHVAQSRLERIAYEKGMAFLRNGIPSFSIKRTESLSGSKGTYLSLSERIASEVLLDVYCVPVDDETQEFGGLSLRSWIRGYALYERMAHTDEEEPELRCIVFTREELTKLLVNVGLSVEHAHRFIQLTTLQRYSLDLFDAPLIRVSDSSLQFFAPAFHAPQIAGIVLSRIGSLNRARDENGVPADPVQFQDKGRRFEHKILRLFEDAGIPARSFKYKLENTEFECDVVAILDGVAFVFECKNYNIPLGRVTELHHFLHSMEAFRRQVSRIAVQLQEHPEIIEGQFGADVRFSKVVLCVLQALPWSMGKTGEVYFCDQSALIRFVAEGAIRVHSLSSTPSRSRTLQHQVKLRSSLVPTAGELLTELDNPVQLKLHCQGWSVETTPAPIGEGFWLAIPEWRQRPISTEEQLAAMGFREDQIVEVVHELSSGSMVEKSLAELRPKVRQGRNESCHCGSGRKFKKCCGSR